VERIRQHRPVLYKLCNLYTHTAQDRDDLFQEILFQLWKSYPGFRGEAKFSTWMYRIALNTAISDLRKQKKRVRGTDPEELPFVSPENAQALETEEQIGRLYSAIGSLSEIEKALVMLYLEDKTYAEMEEILGVNENSLRVRMNRIREKLRKITGEAKDGT
jgi:RNA polymerase sigma-70 factor (ECF subfamily)